jgi:glycine oxidase
MDDPRPSIPSGNGPPDVVVVGAGPWGLATAWLLAERRARVSVVDDGAPSAAHAAAGMLAPSSEADHGEEALHRLMTAAAAAWPGFAARLALVAERPSPYHPTGTLMVAARPEHLARVRRQAELIGRLREPPRWVAGTELREIEPALGGNVSGGIALEDEHQADPRALVAALRVACARLGVEIVADAAVALVRDDGGRVRGVELSRGGRRDAGCVVLAAGWAAGRLAPLVPVRPVKGEVLRLRPRPSAPCPITRVVRTPDVYIVPRPGGEVVIGATQEESGDRAPTAGAAHDLLADALAAVPDLREMELAEHLAGLRPATPDGLPAVGCDHQEGLVWAVGGFRHGILLTPIAAEAAARAAAGEPPPAGWSAFAPVRFGGRTSEAVACA